MDSTSGPDGPIQLDFNLISQRRTPGEGPNIQWGFAIAHHQSRLERPQAAREFISNA
jgi:hypothetical protein